jgi:hypothetical protein
MATSTPTAQLPTRQQLDEIDALLRRMLTLPATSDEPPATPQPHAPVGMTYPTPTIREIPPLYTPATGDPVVHAWRAEWPQSPAPSPPASVVSWGSPVPLATPAEAPYSPPYQPSSPPGYSPAGYSPPAPVYTPPMIAPQVYGAAPTAVVRPPVPISLWPFILLNGTFNILSYLLGPLGTWLRGPGRTMMGWLGIGLILAAGVWAAGEWYGYDWPKIDAKEWLAKLGISR